jgi:hypothetical protein
MAVTKTTPQGHANVALVFAEILNELHPETSWTVSSPDVGVRAKGAVAVASAGRQVELLSSAKDDLHPIARGDVPRTTRRRANEDRLDPAREQAA